MSEVTSEGLISQQYNQEGKEQFVEQLHSLIKINLKPEQITEVENIANGVYSPLTGFLGQNDFTQVVEKMQLSDGTIWPLPIILDINEDQYQQIKDQYQICLADKNDQLIALLKNIEVFSYSKSLFVKNVFGTLDRKHPGVSAAFEMGNYLVGGEIKLIQPIYNQFQEFYHTPEQTRQIFKGRGWQKIVAFQTRNVPHTGHEFIQKHALDQVDGLFIQPVVGPKKADDFSDQSILSAYELLIEKYYQKNKVLLGILPLKMKYAGPREAVFHALIRKNYGCTHFIVGRDHAGVGGYYHPYAAHELLDQIGPEKLGIQILKYPEVVYDRSRNILCFSHDCLPENKQSFSGSKLRQYLESKTVPPNYLIRPEIFHHLTQDKNSLLQDSKDKAQNLTKGFVLWLTGLSQSGKSTIADYVYELLKTRNIRVERLDGDIVREYFSKGLTFSKEDRMENIRRVGFVAKLLSRNGVAVIASFISPYKQQREELKIGIENFIEVFVDTPLEICEQRDKKGNYAKARRGEILNFTGISDIFEIPDNPDLRIKGGELSIQESAEKVFNYLQNNHLI